MTPGSYLAKDGECIAIQRDGQPVRKIPIHTLESLVCFGPISISPFCLGHCAENNVSVSWLTENGRFLGALRGPVSGNVLLRKAQYRLSDNLTFASTLARSFCIGKIVNCRTVLRRTARERNVEELDRAADKLGFLLDRLEPGLPLETVRGLEGEAAALYFSVFNFLISNDDPAFTFNGRNRRPPLDAVNCLLSFLYTILTHDLRAALETVGLDPMVGFLHRDRPGRPSLALDMIEEFRPYLADRLALTLINRGQVKAKDFKKLDSGAVVMDDACRKEVLTAYQSRKQEDITHPFLNEKMTLGLLWHMQARLLARHLRGDLDAYPPFTVR
jgi:CRISPR-associated protein Cas1